MENRSRRGCDETDTRERLDPLISRRDDRSALTWRLEERFEPNDPVDVTLYVPQVNVPVSEAELTFAPPAP